MTVFEGWGGGTVLQVLAFDDEAARFAARIRVRLERAGKSIGPPDTLIAGIAIRYGATLVTHNTAEFSRVPRLQATDWH
jgi:tRNA(fMet)-specific endonuclease VapC